MKTKSFFLTLSLLSILWISGVAQDDVAAVKAVIEKETFSFQNVDRKNWADSWLQAPYAYWSYSDSTGTSFVQSWNAIDKSFDTYFKTQVSSRQIDVARKGLSIERKWGEIRIYKNGAFVQYIQKVKDGMIDRDETSQIRFLEKVNGKWKIVYVGIIAQYPND
ncbi:MAG: hypothetical protein JJE09_03955 [Bacteroidia bacterium]|nr:hypothetical protein [Bacteroidia bacterium]